MTTIQVSVSTKQVLEVLKRNEGKESYDDVIQHLLKTHTKVAESMFGAIKGLSWKKEDRSKLHEL
ncbi:MAG: hypothetical protein HY363_03615 [Candidatus Aenigmarchaeota archaeon]|nr:hypothetical protein [Candidatus Aenigmarchaeota archaeon]